MSIFNGGRVTVDSLPSSATLYEGTVSPGTSAVVLGSSQACQAVIVQADPANTANVLVGNATGQHWALAAGAGVSLAVADVALIYVKAASGTQVVNWLARS